MASIRPLLKVAAEVWIPYVNLIIQENGNISVTGPMASFLEIFSQKKNFNYEIVRPADHIWGNQYENGSYNGMMGMLQREEVEFALGPFFISYERMQVVDFTFQIYRDFYAIFLSRPTITNDISGFTKPFTPLVWLLILLSMLGIASAMNFVAWMEMKIFNNGEHSIMSKASLWMIQTLSQESSDWLPKNDGGRVLVFTWLMASLVFMSSYGGILTAMLTVPKVFIPIDSAADLVAQSKVPWKLETGTVLFRYLRESTDEIMRQVYEKRAPNFDSCWERRQKIADGEFAAICDYTSMKKIISWDFSTTGNCHLYISRQKIYSGIMTMAFKANSTYLSDANDLITSLMESGIIDKWLDDQITNTTVCLRPPSADRGDGISPLGTESFSGPFLLLATGYISSTLVLVLELIFYRCCTGI